MIDEPGWYSYPVVDDDSFEVNVIAEVDADPDDEHPGRAPSP